MPCLSGSVFAAVVVSVVASAPAPLAARIDRLVTAGHPGYLSLASPPASDAEFLRRVTLDLTGSVATADEVRAFLADADPAKRARLIDRLLAGPGFARRMAQVYDVWFMERRKDEKVPRAAWEQHLRAATAANTPFDTLVRNLLSADGVDPATRPGAKFYLDRDGEPHLVTRDIGRLFLGRDWQCAQCHDHPTVEDYTQADYHGLFAFLNRTVLFPAPTVPTAVLGEKADGEVTFVSVFDRAKRTHTARPRLPAGETVAEPRPVKGQEYTVAPAKDVRPVPTFSRRARLAGRVVAHPAFARTAVNRLWATLMGHGLVHPLDLDHAGNPPSHPELLDLLADEFAAHRFDVKWLVRQIVRSETYQRSSEVSATVPTDRLLAAEVRPLLPEQLAYAVLQATGRVDAERAKLGKAATPAAVDAALAPQVQRFRAKFAAAPGQLEGGFTPSLDQSLFLKFGPTVRGLLDPKAGGLTRRLAWVRDDRAVADELFLSLLGRPPTADERADVVAMLAGATDRPAAVAEAAWAVLASAEFRFNH